MCRTCVCVSGVSEDGGRVISAVVCMALCFCVCPEVKEISYRLALAPSLHHGAPLSSRSLASACLRSQLTPRP